MATPYMKLNNGDFVPKDTYDDIIFEIEHSSLVHVFNSAREDAIIADKVYWDVLNSDIDYNDKIIESVTDKQIKADEAYRKACDSLCEYFGTRKYYTVFLPIMFDYIS